MKNNKLKLNGAGGYDFLTERDGGNPVLILTGNPKYSAQYWRSVKRLADKAISLLKGKNQPNEVPDELPEWEELNKKLLSDVNVLRDALKPLVNIANAVFVDTRKDKQGVLYGFNSEEITYEDLRKSISALEKTKQ